MQTGRFPSHLTFRDLQLKQANPYRRAFRADEDAEPEAGPWAKPRPRPGRDVVPGVDSGRETSAATDVEGIGDLGVVEATGVAASSPSDSLAEVLIRAWWRFQGEGLFPRFGYSNTRMLGRNEICAEKPRTAQYGRHTRDESGSSVVSVFSRSPESLRHVWYLELHLAAGVSAGYLRGHHIPPHIH